MAEDYDLYLRMARAGVTINAIDEEHVSYRKHPKATTSRRQAGHDAVMTVRRSMGLNHFPSRQSKPTPCQLARNLLCNTDQRAMWQDSRWNDA